MLSAQKTAFCILHFIFCFLDFIFYILHFTFIILHHSHEDIYEERRQEKKDASDNDVLFCDGTKLDEISGKFQTAFAPPALIFGKSY